MKFIKRYTQIFETKKTEEEGLIDLITEIDADYFLTLADWREQQINSILD
jgi:hypothetical protein